MGIKSLKEAGNPKSSTGSPWEQFDGELQRYLMRRLHHVEDARDLAQEVYFRLLRFGGDECVQNFRAYLYKVASNVVYEFKFRRQERFFTADSDAVKAWAENPAHVPHDQLGDHLNTEQQLEQMLSLLHPTCRAVLVLHKRDGLSYEEVAKELDISIHTVKKYVARGLAMLRRAKWDL